MNLRDASIEALIDVAVIEYQDASEHPDNYDHMIKVNGEWIVGKGLALIQHDWKNLERIIDELPFGFDKLYSQLPSSVVVILQSVQRVFGTVNDNT